MLRLPALALSLLSCVLLALPAAASARVMHGEDAQPGELPWTVALVVNSTDPELDEPVEAQFCGGSLVAADVVVTAAHCVMGSDPEDQYVFAGEEDLTDYEPLTHRFDVESIHLPTSAEVDPDDPFAVPRYDIAILKLDTPVPTPEPIVPVQDGEETLWADGADLEVMGWGVWADAGSVYPDVLQHATIDRVSDEDCEDAWGAAFFAEDMVCALGNTGPPDDFVVDSCVGDSGGPLTTIGTDESDPATGWKLVGTVSFGSELCDDPQLPGVYARVDHPTLRSFIEDFSDGEDPDDPPEQIRQTGGSPILTGTLAVGEQIDCDPADTTWSADPGVTEEPRVRLYDESIDEAFTVSIGGPYTLTESDVGERFLCEVHAKKSGIGGYGVARSGLSPVVSRPSVPPPPPTPPATIVQVLPPPPEPQPFVPEPRDEGLPQTQRVSRRCNRRTRRCTLDVFTVDTTTGGARPAGVTAVQLRLTTRYRCGRRGRRRTCTSRRTLGARPASPPGRFTVRTPKLRRGRHTLRVVAIDGAGNREPRALTYSFRLR